MRNKIPNQNFYERASKKFEARYFPAVSRKSAYIFVACCFLITCGLHTATSKVTPREAVVYSPVTSLRGMIEKDTGVNPFDVPQKLKDLQRTRDFGRFGANGSVPVNFLATTNIIGGNSGSPILRLFQRSADYL